MPSQNSPRALVTGLVLVVACVLLLSLPKLALADAPTARKFISDAKEEIEGQHWDGAEQALKLAEAALDDATPAERDAIKKEIADTRTDMTTKAAAIRKRPFLFSIKDHMDNAKRYMGQPREFNDVAKELNELLASDDAKLFMDPKEIESLKKELAALQKVSDQKFGGQAIARVKEQLAKVEKELPPALKSIETPDSPDQIPASRNARDLIDQLNKEAESLPADDTANVLRDRIKKFNDAYNTAVATGDSADFLKRIQTDWIADSKQFEGWQSEPDAPTDAG